jgi:hypothetical protein
VAKSRASLWRSDWWISWRERTGLALQVTHLQVFSQTKLRNPVGLSRAETCRHRVNRPKKRNLFLTAFNLTLECEPVNTEYFPEACTFFPIEDIEGQSFSWTLSWFS